MNNVSGLGSPDLLFGDDWVSHKCPLCSREHKSDDVDWGNVNFKVVYYYTCKNCNIRYDIYFLKKEAKK